MSSSTPYLASPAAYPRVKLVHSFAELIATPLADGINAVCWPRSLEGDYAEVVAALGPGPDDEPLRPLDEATLHALPLSPAGRIAAEQMLADLALLRAHELDPVLNCIYGYPRDEDAGPVPTDVFSYHADSAPVPAATLLCTYHGPASEGLGNEDAVRRVDMPATRAALLADYGGEDDAEFAAYLSENCFDLHYAPARPDAQPFSFGLGNLWRIAIAYPDCPVPPCVHRAPATLPGEAPRLLLIS